MDYLSFKKGELRGVCFSANSKSPAVRYAAAAPFSKGHGKATAILIGGFTSPFKKGGLRGICLFAQSKSPAVRYAAAVPFFKGGMGKQLPS